MSTWAWLITKPERVRGRAVSSNSGAPREDRIDSPVKPLVPAVKYGLMQRMAALVEDSNDAIISVAGEATVASWNRAAESIFGYTEQEMIGQPIFRLACAWEESAMCAMHDQARNGRLLDHYETRRRCKDGSEIPVSLTVSPIRNAAGEIAGVSEIARNIARQKRAEEAVRISEKLAAVGRLASSVAHDINNPLAAITNLLSFCRTKAFLRKESGTWQPHSAKYRAYPKFRRRPWVSVETAENPTGLRSLPFLMKRWPCTITASKGQASKCCAIMTRRRCFAVMPGSCGK